MNKVFNINLGGYPFAIDDNAFEHLKQYIDGLRRHFADSEGCDEIITDIESRLSELFSDYLKGRQIVTIADVKRGIAVMGTPADFGATTDTPNGEKEPATAAINNTVAAKNSEPYSEKRDTISTGKRLFRNTEDKMVGGVCSGLAAYFGINDPVWIRLAFAALFFGAGVGLPMYILLMIVIPKAKTAADRLAMRGEPINVSNIARTVEEEMGHIKGRIEEIAEEFSNSQKKKTKSGNEQSYRATYTPNLNQEQVADFLGSLKKTVLAGGIGFLVLILGIIWIGMLGSFVFSRGYASFLFDNPMLADFGFLSLFLTVSLPIIGLILLFMKWFYKAKITRLAVLGISLVWLASLATLTVLAASSSKEFLYEGNTKQFIPIKTTDDQPLKIVSSNGFNESEGGLQFGHIKAQDNQLVLADVTLVISATDEPNFSLEKTVFSRGYNARNAQDEITKVQYDIQQTNNTLELAPFFTVQKGGHWRQQHIELTLNVPKGKKIILDETVSNALTTQMRTDEGEDSDIFYESRYDTHQWAATNEGLKCVDCETSSNEAESPADADIMDIKSEETEMIPEPDPTAAPDTL